MEKKENTTKEQERDWDDINKRIGIRLEKKKREKRRGEETKKRALIHISPP